MGDFDFEELSTGTGTGTGTAEPDLGDSLNADLTRLQAQLGDVTNKVGQSRSQLDQLRQRNAMVMAEVKKLESTIQQFPPETVRQSYTEALSVQQRLLTTQSQMEKFEAQEASLREQIELLKTLRQRLEHQAAQAKGESFNAREIIIKVIDAQEEERDRLARQMHDGPAHSLTNFILQAEICQKLFDRNPDKARDELANLKTKAGEAFQKVRSYIFDLRPMMLSDLGLAPTLQRYVDQFGEKTGIKTDYTQNGPSRRLEGYREVLVFRGIQSIMMNTRDRGGANAIKVALDMGSDRVRVSVEDNGRGLGTGQLNMDSNNPEALYLGALQDRINLVGGSLRVDMIPGGTRIEFDIPAGPEPEAGDDDLSDLR